ncbi:MAG TPA: aromatic ring-hydroxylating dioxygenase subunit alpha [Steroidobacteraceae bacterium]
MDTDVLERVDEMYAVRLGLCRRMVEHARNGTTDLAPGVMFNDVAAYTDAQRFELECRGLFRDLPQVVCFSSDLPEPGSFRTFDETGVPLVVVRGQDGHVRAFLNVCTHRGARLVREPQGRARGFTCRFHGWTFDAAGRAKVLPQEKHFCGAVDDRKQLVPCPAAERHGLVFVRAVPHAVIDLDDWLGPFGPELARLDLAQARRVCERELVVTCNWKYALDTYFENYHFASLHKTSLFPLFPNNMSLYDTWGPHHRLVFPSRAVWDWVNLPEAEWLVDTIGTPYFVFPNTIVYAGSLRPDQASLTCFQLYPRAVGETVTKMSIYAPKGVDTAENRAEIEQAFDGIVGLVRDEDYSVTGESWRNLQHLPAGSRMVYGRQELALQNLHRWIARTLDLPAPEVVAPPVSGD